MGAAAGMAGSTVDALWDACVVHGLWSHRLQRPGYVVPGYTLHSAPWWTDTNHLLGEPEPGARTGAGAEQPRVDVNDMQQQPVHGSGSGGSDGSNSSDNGSNDSCSADRERRYSALR